MLNPRGLLLFDIDGVIRDVGKSYRLAIQETVYHFSLWRPTIKDIDELKTEGIWNNDWDASLELIKRYCKKKETQKRLIPSRDNLIEVFNGFYFGGDPNGDINSWKGFIKNEPLLINKEFFNTLTDKGFLWGFISGAEPPSAKFVLETRLCLHNPPLIAMGDAPDKPDPTGLIQLAVQLIGGSLGKDVPPIFYIGDTVADVLTVVNAQNKIPNQKFISFAISPPHLHGEESKSARLRYETMLRNAGAEMILQSLNDLTTQIYSE